MTKKSRDRRKEFREAKQSPYYSQYLFFKQKGWEMLVPIYNEVTKTVEYVDASMKTLKDAKHYPLILLEDTPIISTPSYEHPLITTQNENS